MSIDDYVRRLDSASTIQDKVDLINDVTSDEDVHVFGELLSDPRLACLEAEAPAAHQLLRLFAYGTYADYAATAAPSSALSPRQLRKLRRLSVVQAARTQRSLAYASLLTSLGLDSVPELESLLAEMITMGLFQGKLDQRDQLLQVYSCMGRDVPPEELPSLVAALEAWSEACRQSLGLVCSEMETAEARHAQAQQARRQVEERVEAERAKALAQREAATAATAAPSGHDSAEYGSSGAGAGGASSMKSLKKVRLSAKK
ncbi:hypothetical protein BOX15_Mlig008983g2 [Macrostomum lignano]|uniref:Uncharacterized protein n=2 Tax=Macrostomum lignano TaxID=282301 RepID=A0A267GJI8_9PLAT|nr:hypothetical protein BOX15_Mlig008983g2 [Macrostomum lignano]